MCRHVCVRIDMIIDMRIDMIIDECIVMHMHMRLAICRHGHRPVYGHAHRHVHRHVCMGTRMDMYKDRWFVRAASTAPSRSLPLIRLQNTRWVAESGREIGQQDMRMPEHWCRRMPQHMSYTGLYTDAEESAVSDGRVLGGGGGGGP